MRRLIGNGTIQVSGVAALQTDSDVAPTQVTYSGAALDPLSLLVLLHKPAGYICTHNPNEGKTIYELLPERFLKRRPQLASVGRLDQDASGALLLTDDGQLLHKLSSPKSKISKVYEVELSDDLNGTESEIFASGNLMLRSETKPLLPAELRVISARKAELHLYEGRYHQVKRMFGACGNKVASLHRSHVCGLSLHGLEPGQYKIINAADLAF